MLWLSGVIIDWELLVEFILMGKELFFDKGDGDIERKGRRIEYYMEGSLVWISFCGFN